MSDASSMTGRVCVVTGANAGIGRVTAVELARRGAHVVLACRSRERTQPVLDEIAALGAADRCEFLALDLGDFSAVRTAAAELLARDRPIHVLVNNAGLAGQRGLTRDGFELHFGVNHLGPFLFTELLRQRLEQSAPARVVFVASRAHKRVKGIDWDAVRTSTPSLTGFREYSTSKLANVLHNRELARRLEGTGVTTYALHPGVVASEIWRRVPWPFRSLIKLRMITPEEGAQTSIHCATAPELENQTGLYYDECKPKAPSPTGQDDTLAAELWTRSEAWTAPS
jgi:retinol dehydrogenase 12